MQETCTDPCDLNRSDEAASTAADDDQIKAVLFGYIRVLT